MKKVLRNTLILLCLILLAFPINIFHAFATDNISQISGRIYLDGVVVNDLSTIAIELYNIEDKSELNTGHKRYEHNYEKTIFPTTDGKFSFYKTSDLYYARISLDTLPTDIGVENEAIFITAEMSEIHFVLCSKVDSNYKSVDKKLSMDRTIVNSQENEYDDLNVDTVENVLNRLITNDFETENEFHKAYDYIWRYNISNQTQRSLSESLNPNFLLQYTNERTYTRSGFTIHYESGVYSETSLNAIAVLFNFAKSSLCSTFDFLTPPLKTDGEDGGTYHVYLTSQISYAGVTLKYMDESNGSSYIIINIPNNFDYEGSYYKGLIAHEYMHAVQYAYVNNYEANWYVFNEATAHLARITCSPYGSISTSVNKFLNTPEKSLFNNEENRGAGGVLFPLYIKENYSGMNTIRKIYEAFNNNSVYSAIDSALSLSNSSLTEAYIGFRLASYNIRANYDFYQSGWLNTPAKVNLNGNYSDFVMPLMSTLYMEKVNSGNTRTYTFTVGTENSNLPTKLDLKCVVTDANGVETVYQETFTGAYCTVSYRLQTNSKLCFVLSNISNSESEEIYANMM